jgi:hypothetical protein
MNRVWRRGERVNGRRQVIQAIVEAVERRQLFALSVTYVNVPISAAARAADPTLNDLRTVDVQLKVSGGDDWLASDIKLVLTTGSFYNPRAGGNTPVPAAWSSFPYLEFDTFVSGPSFAAPTILGRKEGTGSAVFSPTEVNVAFGDLVNTGDGTYTIARLTMTSNAVGQLEGNVFAQTTPGTAFPINTLISPLTSTISGRLYNDLNADGKRQSAEPSLIKWQVFIDKNNNGQLDSGEYSVRTNNKGAYTFVNPGNTTHRIRVRVQDGFRRSAPASGSYNVAISPGVVATNKDFGVTQRGRIGGFVFRDTDGDKVRDSGESGLGGWRVYIDADNDGRFDTGEANMRTLTDGSYTFNNLGAGTYRVRVVQVGGWTRTTPTTGVFSITVVSGTDSQNNLFGQRQA